jgi:hypothetical protein
MDWSPDLIDSTRFKSAFSKKGENPRSFDPIVSNYSLTANKIMVGAF